MDSVLALPTEFNNTENSILIYDFIDIDHKRRIKKMKDELSREGGRFEGLAMVDAIQRLGIEYRFYDEIHAILHTHYTNHGNHDQASLKEVALRFRLLRQEGYYVPAGVFDDFKVKDEKYKESLSCNIEGLINLYEASHLSIEDEHSLDEAREYSYELLNSLMATNNLNHCQIKAIENSVKHPYHKSLPNLMSKNFLTSYFNLQGEIQWFNELLQVADIEFQIVQLLHQEEIVQVLKWWKDMGLSKELKFARDEPLKWFMWSITALTDPSLSRQRVDLVKPISLVYIIDDIFDVYGTLEDLTLFTTVVLRWDISAIEKLPNCMKICFEALDNVTNEISRKVYKQHGWNPVNSLRKSWGSLCKAFLVEARWFSNGKIPSAEEYLENGIESAGVHLVLLHLFFLLGENINKKNVEFIEGNPGITCSTAKILRLWDDLGSAKDEKQEGKDGSYVEYYMKENEGSCRENARKRVVEMISETWKQLNQDCLFHNPFSPTFTKACLNVARMVPLMYSYDEDCSLPLLDELMKSFV